MKLFTIIILAALSLTALATDKVVYGIDNRMDVYEVRNKLYLKLAKGTAGMVKSTKVKKNSLSDTYSIKATTTLGKGMNLCSSESFYDQKLLANCSGFLVGEDLLVTAGHCMVKRDPLSDPCEDNKWIFGLEMESETDINLDKISKDNVYSCKRIIVAKLTDSDDFAVVKLDRKVVGRTPLKYRDSGKISSRTPLVVIGHPTMLPTKISGGGKVLDNSKRTKFITNLDTFGGNSGSAVFNAKTGVVEGILVSGKTDYLPSRPLDKNSCRVVNRCSTYGYDCDFVPPEGQEDADGEAVTRMTSLTQYIDN